MERKKILFPSNYTNKEGEKKTIWRNGGYGFVNYESGELININLYLDIFPFEKNIRLFLKEPDVRNNNSH